MTTDFRALCAELLDEIGHESPTTCLARAALAQPEPQAPTVMEIIALADEIEAEELGQVDLVRRALARWGSPAIEPVPVGERLPGPKDCLGRPFEETDAGYCWWWFPKPEQWCFVEAVIWRNGSYRNWTPTSATHWLPHHALPVPQQEVK